jgi:putative restriction endonuclease
MNFDHQIRTAALAWLSQIVQIYGDNPFPRNLLLKGFYFQGRNVTLISQRGIWKPKGCDVPISISTTPNSPYKDHKKDAFINYKYMGSDPNHADNAGLRRAMEEKIPLIYFYAFKPSQYFAEFPVYIIDEDRYMKSFLVAGNEALLMEGSKVHSNVNYPIEKRYYESPIKGRYHQREFREIVLTAYQEQCTLCRLKHRELLDAAHIIPDAEEHGDAVVTNGLSLCKIHHAAFDKNIIGISPDYTIKVREDILLETDGPMLKHGIQELDSQKMILPYHKKDWPDQERLEERYHDFQAL